MRQDKRFLAKSAALASHIAGRILQEFFNFVRKYAEGNHELQYMNYYISGIRKNVFINKTFFICFLFRILITTDGQQTTLRI